MFLINKNINKLYLFLLFGSILLPSFNSVDNVNVRWLVASTLSFFYLLNHLIFLKKKIIINSKIDYFILIFLSICLISLYYTNNFNESILSFLKIFCSFLILICLNICLSSFDNQFRQLSIIFSISLLIESVYAIISFFLFDRADFTGISMNRNISSFSILLKIPFLIYLVFHENINKKVKLSLYFLIFTSIISITILQSRAAIITLLLILILFLFYNKKKQRYYNLAFIFLTLFSLNIIINNDSSYLRSKSISISSISYDNSFNNRVDYAKIAFNLFKSNPIFGNGIGSFKTESIKYVYKEGSDKMIPYHSHNEFLQFLSEIGIFGFLAFIVALLWILYLALNKLNQPQKFIFLTSSLFIIFIDLLLNFPLQRPQQLIIILSVFSIIISMSELKVKTIKSNYINYFVILISSIMIFSFYKNYKLSVFEKKLIQDFETNYSIDPKVIDKIPFKFPNLMSNATPISGLIARYYLNKNELEKAKNFAIYSESINPYISLNKEVLLSVYLQTGDTDEAIKIAKNLFEQYPSKIDYAEIYFTIASQFNFENIFIKLDIHNYNLNVNEIFFYYYSKLREYNKEQFRIKLIKSLGLFSDSKILNSLLEDSFKY